jgi:hypothetical protein
MFWCYFPVGLGLCIIIYAAMCSVELVLADAVGWLVSSIPACPYILMAMDLLACSLHSLCDAFPVAFI